MKENTKEEYAFKPRRRLEKSPIVKEKLVGQDSEMEVDSQAELTDQSSNWHPVRTEPEMGGNEWGREEFGKKERVGNRKK